MLSLELLLFLCKIPHFLGELLMILLRGFCCLLELLVLSLVLLKDSDELLLFLNLDLGLLFVGFDLLLQLFSLVIDLRSQRVFDVRLLAILLTELGAHQLHLLGTLLLKLLILHLQIFSFLLDELVLFLRLGDIISHLGSDRAEMIVEVL